MPCVEDDAILYSDSVKTTWPRSPHIKITIRDAPPFFLPLNFVAQSGNNTWALVHHLMQLVVNEAGELRRKDGIQIVLAEEPCAVECVFVPVDATDFTWTKGPQSATRGKVEKDEPDDVSSRNSSRSSTRQTKLRFAVMLRDGGQCIVSDAGAPTLCQAAHLVPKSRPDVYEELLGDDFVGNLFHVTMAVTIKADLHLAYDSYKWSFYCKDGTMFVHVFAADSYLLPFHGHAITSNRFNWRHGGEYLPDVRLCNWHYKQCVLMYFRLFSAGMAVNAR